MLADYHVHTSFSDDAVIPMEEVVKIAIEKGLDEICFTEHMDYGVKTDLDHGSVDYQERLEHSLKEKDTGLNCDCEAYQKELERCRRLYGDRIHIRMGMEFGMQTHTVDAFQKVFDRYPFDFIILSCHQVGDQEFWTGEFQKGKTQAEYNRRYYEEILKVVRRYDDYSVLGHLDMIRRYDPTGDFPLSGVQDLVEEILRTVIAGGKGIEINTSCFRYGLKDLTPSREILQLYRRLGGEIVTIGSDAHTGEWVGCQAAEMQRELRRLGFSHICLYEQMKPVRRELIL